jgi:NAD(P)-dependent dehydrogenase (short-subunit alcohol dehydrogenase family)
MLNSINPTDQRAGCAESAFSASKGAVRSFARVMSAKLLERRIRVNAVSPGSIETPIHRSARQTEKEFQIYVEKSGIKYLRGEWGSPKKSLLP